MKECLLCQHAKRWCFLVLQVDLLVAMQALPLQGLCLLVLPLPWAFPRLLNLQFANPLALFEGTILSNCIRLGQKILSSF